MPTGHTYNVLPCFGEILQMRNTSGGVPLSVLFLQAINKSTNALLQYQKHHLIKTDVPIFIRTTYYRRVWAKS